MTINKKKAKAFIDKHCPYKKIMNTINYNIYDNKLCMSEVHTLYDKDKDSIFKIDLDEDNIIFTLIPANRHNMNNVSIPISLSLDEGLFDNSLDNALFIFNYKINQLNNKKT